MNSSNGEEGQNNGKQSLSLDLHQVAVELAPVDGCSRISFTKVALERLLIFRGAVFSLDPFTDWRGG